jgi:Skp family chaperone for outer membrane proteins
MLVTAMFLGITTVAQAQDQGRGGRPNMAAMMLKDITLSPTQQSKVDSINAKYRDQMTALRNEGGDRETMMQKRRDLMEKQRDEIKAVLTDDQKKVFDKNVEDMRANMQNRRPPSDR